MAKRQRSRKEQLAEVIRESHEQWKRLRENGCNDPFWTDGVASVRMLSCEFIENGK